jgi:dihydrofolate reductase
MTQPLPTAAPPPLTLVAAVARNGAIGSDGQLVWRHPEDARWFRQQTLGCPVVMGRKTWDSLPPKFRPLPGRPNIVVTRQTGWQAEGAQVAHGLNQALAMAAHLASQMQAPPPRLVVIGGAALYAQALPLADELLLTEVQADLPGDTFFPAWDRAAFTEVGRTPGAAPDGPAFDFVRYQRRGALTGA